MRASLAACVLAACTSSSSPTPGAGDAPPPAEVADDQPPSQTSALVVEHEWPMLAARVALSHDGKRWAAVLDHDLVVHEGGREVQRFANLGIGNEGLRSLPDGGWVAGARVLAADGTVRFDGYAWSNRLGRFATAKATAVSPDGRVAIVAGSDAPSTCLRDRGCGAAGSHRGAVVRVDLDGDPVGERLLFEHEDRHSFFVAASNDAVATLEGLELSVWPATGDGAPRTATVSDPTWQSIDFASDGSIVGRRWRDAEHAEIIVLDGTAPFAERTRWAIEGQIYSIASHPTNAEIAVSISEYRARERVEIDEKRIEVYSLDGTRRVRIDTPDYAVHLSWSALGDALLAAISGHAHQAVVRYRVE